MAVEIPSRCMRPSVYLSLRGMGFPWWTSARVMWRGASLSVEERP